MSKPTTLTYPVHTHMPVEDAEAMDRFIADLLPTLRGYIDVLATTHKALAKRSARERELAGLVMLVVRCTEIMLTESCEHYTKVMEERVIAYGKCAMARGIALKLGVSQEQIDELDRKDHAQEAEE